MNKVICSTCRFRFKDLNLPQGMIQCALDHDRKKERFPRTCQDHRILPY